MMPANREPRPGGDRTGLGKHVNNSADDKAEIDSRTQPRRHSLRRRGGFTSAVDLSMRLSGKRSARIVAQLRLELS
jgi:hypothetical protein